MPAARLGRAPLIASLLLTAPLIAADPLTDKQLHQARQVIRPQAGEDKWDQIRWRIHLWEARTEAAAAGKPILLWEMDGHPLGCT